MRSTGYDDLNGLGHLFSYHHLVRCKP